MKKLFDKIDIKNLLARLAAMLLLVVGLSMPALAHGFGINSERVLVLALYALALPLSIASFISSSTQVLGGLIIVNICFLLKSLGIHDNVVGLSLWFVINILICIVKGHFFATPKRRLFLCIITLLLMTIPILLSIHLNQKQLLEAASEGNTQKLSSLLKSGTNINKRGPNGETPLCIAVIFQHEDAVKLLLENGADPNIGAQYHFPIYQAFEKYNQDLANLPNYKNHNYAIIKLLFEHGADPNAKDLGFSEGRTPFQEAVYQKHKDLVMLLLEHGANPNVTSGYGTPLHDAVRTKTPDIDTIKLLLEHNANPNVFSIDGKSPLWIAAVDKNLPVVQLLLKHGADPDLITSFGGESTALIIAASNGSLEIVKALLDAKADVNIIANKEETALSVALNEGHEKIASLLRQYGAKTGAELRQVNATPISTNQNRQISQNTQPRPTYSFAEQGIAKQQDTTFATSKPVSTKTNKAQNNSINTPDQFGETPLLKAVKKGQIEEVKNLIAQGADVNFVDPFKSSVLMTAVKKGNTDIVKLLIAAGANVNYKDKFGKSALQIAEQKGNAEIINFLKSAGAKE